MFGSIEALVSFSFVWYACVMARCKMIMWLRALLGRCARQRSHGVTTEGFAVEKISSVGFCFVGRGRSCGSEVFRSLSRRKVRNNLLRNVLKEAKYLS
jgi:hypothetical protein